jgi:hypothetical protein
MGRNYQRTAAAASWILPPPAGNPVSAKQRDHSQFRVLVSAPADARHHGAAFGLVKTSGIGSRTAACSALIQSDRMSRGRRREAKIIGLAER